MYLTSEVKAEIFAKHGGKAEINRYREIIKELNIRK